MRYCDDIVFAHEYHEACEEALATYMAELDEIRLPLHAPLPVEDYGAAFWGKKSKLPYQWSTQGNRTGCVPWLAFVGYQVHRDGRVRVRKSSIDKELQKQRQVVCDLQSRLQRAIGAGQGHSIPPASVVRSRVEAHLISIGVGYPAYGPPGALADDGVSWCAGFRGLAGERVCEGGLKRLDRGRKRLIARSERVAASFLERDDVEESPPPEHGPQGKGADGYEFEDSPGLSYVHYFRRLNRRAEGPDPD